MSEYRVERDTMGEVRLPHDAYYGAQTQRAVENFPVSGSRIAPELIHAIGLFKWAAAANRLFSPFPPNQRRFAPSNVPRSRFVDDVFSLHSFHFT